MPVPTAEERRKHNILHTPFRSWCRDCVRGMGKAAYHTRVKDKENELPIIAIDYAFMKPKGEIVKKDFDVS